MDSTIYTYSVLKKTVGKYFVYPEHIDIDDSCTIELYDEHIERMKAGKNALMITYYSFEEPTPFTNNTIKIGHSITANLTITFRDRDNHVTIGNHIDGNFTFDLSRSSIISIGDHTSSVSSTVICDNSEFYIKHDAMISANVQFQTKDQHAIVDLKSGEIINDKRSKVVIDEHVWFGKDSMILGDLNIARGSIIGAKALVNKSVPEFSIYAGVPANLIKSGVSWSRSAIKKNRVVESYIEAFNNTHS